MKDLFLSAVFLWAVLILIALSCQTAAASGATFAEGTKTVPVYRFYFHGPNWDGAHLYRTVPDIPGAGWQAEGIAFYISPVQLPYTVPLYVVYKQSLLDHFYTIDKSARDHCVKDLGYADQGIFGYVLPPDMDLPGASPLHRWVRVWSPGGGYTGTYQDHFYQTASSAVADYSFERVECQVWTAPLTLPNRFLQIGTPLVSAVLRSNDMPLIGWRVWSNGGFIRLSYSTNNGATWIAIASVPNNGNFGEFNEQTYNSWKVPASAIGKILIKADWLKDTNGQKPPWVSDTRGPLTVVSNAIRVVKRP